MNKRWTDEEIQVIFDNLDKTDKEIANLIGRCENSITIKRQKLRLLKKEAGKRWSEAEDEFLRNHTYMSVNEIAKKLVKTSSGVQGRKTKLGIKLRLEHDFKKWTDEEIEFLKTHTHMTVKELIEKLKRPENTIGRKINDLGLKVKSNVKRWTEDEDNFLKNNVGMSLTELSNKLNRTRNSVKTRKTTLCLYGSRGQKWTDEEIKFIERNKNLKTAGEIGKALNKTTQSVYRKIHKMKDGIKISQVKFWSNDEIELLRKHYLHKTLTELSKLLTDRSELQIRAKMSRLGISAIDIKSPQKWSKEDDGFLKNNTHMSLAELSQKLQISKPSVRFRMDKFGWKLKNGRSQWTTYDITFLKNNNSTLNPKEIAEQLGRTESAVLHKINKLGICSERVHVSDDIKWTLEEEELLMKHKDKQVRELMTMFPNRTAEAIYDQKCKISVAKYKIWTKEETLIIYKNRDKTDEWIGKLTGRSKYSVKTKRQELNLLRQQLYQRWTKDEEEFLKENYDVDHDKLANVFGISKKRLRLKLIRMGLVEKEKSRRVWSDEETTKLKEILKTTNSIDEICKAFPDRTYHSVQGKRRELPRPVKEKSRIKNGYVQILINNKYVSQHRHLMEQWFGIKSTKTLAIHHINFDKTCNIPKNLIFLTPTQHSITHTSINKLMCVLLKVGYIVFDRSNNTYKINIIDAKLKRKTFTSFNKHDMSKIPRKNNSTQIYSSKRTWSLQEIEILENNKNMTCLELCSLLPKRSVKAIEYKMLRLGIPIITLIRSDKGFTNKQGYHTLSINCKKVLEHRAVMALELNRMIRDEEVIHHISGDRMCNEAFNLVVFPNHSSHRISELSFNHCIPELYNNKIIRYSRKTNTYKLGKNFNYC